LRPKGRRFLPRDGNALPRVWKNSYSQPWDIFRPFSKKRNHSWGNYTRHLQRGDIMSKLTKKQLEELEVLKNMSDEEIDTSDIPEIQDWSQAKIGQFYRPVKKQI